MADDFDDYSNETELELDDNGKLKKKSLFSRVLKWIFAAVIIAANIAIIARMLSSGDPAEMKALIWNDKTEAAYQTYGDELVLVRQEPVQSITRDGKFSFSSMVYIPEAKQLQVTIRYNNRSTLEKLREDYGLAEKPSPDSELFDITLYGSSGVRYSPSFVTSARKTLYSYRRLIFDGVELDGNDELYLDFYYLEDLDYSAEAYGTILIYHSDGPVKESTVKSSDLKNRQTQAD